MRIRVSYILALILASFSTTQAQDAAFGVALSADSLALGNHILVQYQLKNAEPARGFPTPNFAGFEIVSSRTESQFNLVNGEMSMIAKYTYELRPLAEGTQFIDPVVLELKDGTFLETTPLEVLVVPNSDPSLSGQIIGDLPWDFPRIFEEPERAQPRVNPETPSTPPATPKKPKKKPKVIKM